MKNLKKLLSLAVAAAVAGMPLTALAAEYNLADGSITVSVENGVQKVTQGEVSEEDDAPVIMQEEDTTATSNTITVTTSGDDTAHFVIRNLNIGDVYNISPIEIGDSNAVITVEGENQIYIDYDYSPYEYEGSTAIIHVSGGDLTLTSESGGSLFMENEYSGGAVIGSNADEDFTGNIHITGNIDLTAGSTSDISDGAGIGSGEDGDMSGNITIDGDAKVIAVAQDDGAGIGTGYYGDMSGSINIGGNAKVDAFSDYYGAGIGAGDGGDMSGSINIAGSSTVTAAGDYGAGIGTGDWGDMSGSVNIGEDATVTAVSNYGTGIGSGAGGGNTVTGSITISGNADVTAATSLEADHSIAIGASDDATITGAIAIIGNATVTTGVMSDKWSFDNGEISIPEYSDEVGLIGGYEANEENSGTYIIGSDITINGSSENLSEYITESTGEIVTLDFTIYEDGSVEAATTADSVVVLYDGEEEIPTAPGSYKITCVLTIGETVIEIEIGTLIIEEAEDDTTTNAVMADSLYDVVDENGNEIDFTATEENGVLTISVDKDFATLTGRLSGIATLKARGVKTIVFKTTGATTELSTEEMISYGSMAAEYSLTHDGEEASLTIAGRDASDIL